MSTLTRLAQGSRQHLSEDMKKQVEVGIKNFNARVKEFQEYLDDMSLALSWFDEASISLSDLETPADVEMEHPIENQEFHDYTEAHPLPEKLARNAWTSNGNQLLKALEYTGAEITHLKKVQVAFTALLSGMKKDEKAEDTLAHLDTLAMALKDESGDTMNARKKAKELASLRAALKEALSRGVIKKKSPTGAQRDLQSHHEGTLAAALEMEDWPLAREALVDLHDLFKKDSGVATAVARFMTWLPNA
jgi:hypothetical protein